MGGDWNQNPERNRFGMEGQHAGRGPRGFKRQDNRIEEDINEHLTRHSMIDATDIEVSVQNGDVTLRGHVDSRQSKRIAEDIAESVFGVKEVNNQIKVKNREESEEKHETETSSKQPDRKAS
jgi:osmotically-inducible protein OsmY